MANPYEFNASGPILLADTPATKEDADLRDFCDRIFGDLHRADQRRWAHAYLVALLVTPGKKSIRRLAVTASPSPAAAQSLRQFVNASTWDWQLVLRRLADWAQEHGPVDAWQISRAFLPKRGERSVGVHRHYDRYANRTLNCQVGFGAFLHIGSTALPVAWALSLPGPWNDDRQLRRRARVPDQERYRPTCAHALGLVDGLAERDAATPVVAEHSDDPEVSSLLRALRQRGRRFVVAVPHHLPVLEGEAAGTRAPRPAAALLSTPVNVPAAIGVAGCERERRPVRLFSVPVHLPGAAPAGAPGGPFQLFTRLDAYRRPGSLWITNMPRSELVEAARLSVLTGAAEEAVTAMSRYFGLLDFEGRSYPGWHHHMTLVSAAYTYQALSGADFAAGGAAALSKEWW